MHLRLECLERQRDDLAVVLGMFAAPQPALVNAATQVVYALGVPMECDDAKALPVLDDLSPEKIAKAKALRADLMRATVRTETGRFKKASKMP